MTETPEGSRKCGTCTACCTILAVTELNKPMRWACDHLCGDSCGIYDSRPQTCRQFDCAWLRGDIEGDESLRPDRLGVLIDSFAVAPTNSTRLVAFKVWTGAFETGPATELLRRLAAVREIELSYRDGTWRTIGKAG